MPKPIPHGARELVSKRHLFSLPEIPKLLRDGGAETVIRRLFAAAGVEIDGHRPWDPRVGDKRFFRRVLLHGSLGLGESYMDGWWECDALDELIYRLTRGRVEESVAGIADKLIGSVRSMIFNLQTKRRARRVVEEHYDIGNDLYESFLDPYMQYTCGYFRDTSDLAEAQRNKLDLICKKLQLKSSDRVLDIGCGWGGFARYAAEHYGCAVTGISISMEQIAYARRLCAGYPVEIECRDYRDLEGQYDKVLICGMMEHVGYRNYRTLLAKVREVLHAEGLFLLHTIGRNDSAVAVDPWIAKYIFPNSMIPSIKQIAESAEHLFVMEDWHAFGPHYVKTLKAWHEKFESEWDSLSEKYDERFRRMWRFYLIACAGAFRSRSLQLWQVLFSPTGVPNGLPVVR